MIALPWNSVFDRSYSGGYSEGRLMELTAFIRTNHLRHSVAENALADD